MFPIPRLLNIAEKVKKKSAFLLGPRQTGKTSLIRSEMKKATIYNLLDNDTFVKLSRRPSILGEELTNRDAIIVIDEIQKLPVLLDQVQLMIEEMGIKFLLTGSSARKLRRGGVNLLGGRARTYRLHPFVYRELGEGFDLLKALNRGLLPSLYFSDSPEEDLKSYAGTYLREEIASEGLVRNVPSFSRFLEVAALCNGQLLNYAQVGSDSQVPKSTVQEYFQILRDTLIGHDLPPWNKSRKRKAIATAKFYFFDVGIVRHIQDAGKVKLKSPEFGSAFETYIFHELRSFQDYVGQGELCYWKSTSGFEVDFVINDTLAVEVKGKSVVGQSDLRGLKALREEKKIRDFVIVSLDQTPRQIEGIKILPWKIFLDDLWAGKFI